MRTRPGVLRLPAPPASLALAASILLLLLALALAPASADSAPSSATEGASVQATGEGEGETTGAPASGSPRRTRRGSTSAAGGGEASSGGSGTGEEVTTTAAAPSARHDGRAGSRHAQHVAERQAAHEAEANGESTASGASPAASGDAKTKAQRERERAREQKRRERELQKEQEGKKESRKEREARQAREGEASGGEGAQRAGGGEALTNAPVAVSSAGSAAPTSTTTVPQPPTIAAQRLSHADGASGVGRGRSVRRGGVAGSGGSALAPAPATVSSAALTSAKRAAVSRPVAEHRAVSGPRERGTPLVTSVTRIIGVVPAWLWGLIGALGLLAIAFAISSRVAARRARRLASQRRTLLEDVGLLQTALLPALPERVGPVATSAAYRPASGPGAGGDFYDVFALDDGRVAVLVGDVSGHGKEALPHTTLLRFTLRTYLQAGLSPREALRAAAPGLERQLGGSFATVVLATYDPRERVLVYACAGHPHPLLSGLALEAQSIACSAPPIGTGAATGTRQATVSVPGAARVCFYTDGVIEARVGGGELYGAHGLSCALAQLEHSEAASAGALLDLVREQTDRRPDDMAACLLEIDGGAEPPLLEREELALDRREVDRARTRRFLAGKGLQGEEIATLLASARAVADEHGSVLLTIDLGEGTPRVTLSHDNVAPLRARALARTQEVAL